MANSFLKSTQIARMALALLQREIVLPRLVWSFGQADFAGAQNDTITLRLPAVLTARDYEWRTRTNPIIIDDITETGVDVKLHTHVAHVGVLTDEQLTLDIVSFGEQVLMPQVRAVAERLENAIATEMAAAPYATTVTGTDAWRVALEARKALNDRNVPLAGRVLLLGSAVEIEFLDHDKFVKANESGSTEALRDATIGRIAGFEVVTSNAIPATAAYAFHRTAFAFGNVAPVVPDGATFGRSESNQGLAMRWLRDYDPNYLRDRSVVSSFVGVSSVNDGPLIDADADTQVDDPSNIRAVEIDYTIA